MNGKTTILLVAGLVVAGVVVYHRFWSAEPGPVADPTTPLATSSLPRPRLPAPRLAAQVSPVEAPVENLQPTNVFARLLRNEGHLPKPSRDQIESYLAQNRRSAESLIAACRLAGDHSLLQEAAEKQPHDPQLNFAGWIVAQVNQDTSPEVRRQWLEAFKRSAPENALANYLSAQDYFRSGQTDQGIEEIVAAAGKPQWLDYSANYIQNVEEAYLTAGYSQAEAKAGAFCDVKLPHLAELKRLSDNLSDVSALYREAGDELSAQAALEIGLQLGRRLEESSPGGTALKEVLGLAIQRNLLNDLEPDAPYGNTGQTVQNELDALTQRREALKTLWKQAEPILQTMPDQELNHYFDRVKIFGETAALQWAINREGDHVK